MIEKPIKKESALVKMSNKLAEAKYRLGLQAQRVYLYGVSKIDNENDDLNEIKFYLTDFAEATQTDVTRLYKDIKSISKELMETVITINIQRNEWGMYHLMDKCSYKDGLITMRFDTDMKPHLLNLKTKYSKHFLDVAIQFKSKYSIRVYQILKAREYEIASGRAEKVEFELDTLKGMLGIKEGKYKEFKDFRRNVLEMAENEINNNERAEITFTWDRITHGRKVIGIAFVVNSTAVGGGLENTYTKEQIAEIKLMSGLAKMRIASVKLLKIYEAAVSRTSGYEVDPYRYIQMNYKMMKEANNSRNDPALLLNYVENDYAFAANQLKLEKEGMLDIEAL